MAGRALRVLLGGLAALLITRYAPANPETKSYVCGFQIGHLFKEGDNEEEEGFLFLHASFNHWDTMLKLNCLISSMKGGFMTANSQLCSYGGQYLTMS